MMGKKGKKGKKGTREIQNQKSNIQNGKVEISWEGKRLPAYDRLVTRKIGEWLAHRGGGMVSVLMTSTERVAGMNRKFRGVPKATAVMSFPQESRDKGQGIRGKKNKDHSHLPLTSYPLPLKIWGDVVIAADAVGRYARIERVTPASILEEFVEHGLKGLVKGS